MLGLRIPFGEISGPGQTREEAVQRFAQARQLPAEEVNDSPFCLVGDLQSVKDHLLRTARTLRGGLRHLERRPGVGGRSGGERSRRRGDDRRIWWMISKERRPSSLAAVAASVGVRCWPWPQGTNVVVADINAERAEEVAHEASARGPACLAADTGCQPARRLRRRPGGHAGPPRPGRHRHEQRGRDRRGLPEHIPLSEWERIVSTNLLSVVRSNAAFLGPARRAGPWPHRQYRLDGGVVRLRLRAASLFGHQGRGDRPLRSAGVVPPSPWRRDHLPVPRTGCDQHRPGRDPVRPARAHSRSGSGYGPVGSRGRRRPGRERHSGQPVPAPRPTRSSTMSSWPGPRIPRRSWPVRSRGSPRTTECRRREDSQPGFRPRQGPARTKGQQHERRSLVAG